MHVVSVTRCPPSRQPTASPRPLAESQQHGVKGRKRARRKKSRRGQECPSSERSYKAATLSSGLEEYRIALATHGDTAILEHGHPPPSAPSTRRPHPKLQSSRIPASFGSLPGARDDSTGNGSVSVPAELRVGADGGSGQEKERTLFVAASSVSIHTRLPSFSNRDRRRLTSRKSDLRLLDI